MREYIILDSQLNYGYLEALMLGVTRNGRKFCVGEKTNTDEEYTKQHFDNLWDAIDYYNKRINKRIFG